MCIVDCSGVRSSPRRCSLRPNDLCRYTYGTVSRVAPVRHAAGCRAQGGGGSAAIDGPANRRKCCLGGGDAHDRYLPTRPYARTAIQVPRSNGTPCSSLSPRPEHLSRHSSHSRGRSRSEETLSITFSDSSYALAKQIVTIRAHPEAALGRNTDHRCTMGNEYRTWPLSHGPRGTA